MYLILQLYELRRKLKKRREGNKKRKCSKQWRKRNEWSISEERLKKKDCGPLLRKKPGMGMSKKGTNCIP